MATARLLNRRGLDLLLQPQSHSLRHLSSSARKANDVVDSVKEPCEFLGSWKPPGDPKVAMANLERLRRAYGKQVKQLRKEYAYDMEMLRIQKQTKDDARRETLRIENEERRKAKAAAAKTRAAQRMAIQEEFRQTLMKERAEKLELWRMKENLNQKKKADKKELLHKQSSMWVSQENLDKKILEAILESTTL